MIPHNARNHRQRRVLIGLALLFFAALIWFIFQQRREVGTDSGT